MKSAMGMCLNWKVLAGLAAVGVGVLVFAPDAALSVLPLLLLAACPLSMVAMMFAMRGMGSHEGESCRPTESEGSVEAKRARLGAIREEEQRLERELASTAVVEDAAAGQPASTTPSAASR